MVRAIFDFTFFHPIVMSFLWVMGALHYFFRRERHAPARHEPRPLLHYPPASLLIPCHNEGGNVRETSGAALAQRYPGYEVIAINEGSRDDTAARLNALAAEHPRLRVIHLSRNLG